LPDAHIPRVVTVHDMIHERFRQQFPDADVSIEWKKDAVSRAAHVIAVSHNTKRDLVELLGIAPEKVTVVHHAALPPVERPPHPVGPARYVLFVGLRDGYKNFDLVLKAYASASSVRQDYALICCGGPRFCRAELATMAALGVGDRVMHRSCSDLELAGHYAHASVLVYPSLYEGFGIPVLEAMAYGCPVLASDRSSIPEVAGDAALYFDPTQPEDLRTKLDRVLGDPALAGSMSEQSRANARRFSWDRTFEQTLDVYRMLVG
jgi:glycosyltransferase involved in cell wall biosynthesis